MLMHIDPILTGDLLKALRDMGHGDEIVIADGNYPAHAHSLYRDPIELAVDDTVRVLDAILDVFPVENVWSGAIFIVPQDYDAGMPRQGVAMDSSFKRSRQAVEPLSPLRQSSFYEQAKKAYAIVKTNDPRHYFCYILRKGALPDPTAETAEA